MQRKQIVLRRRYWLYYGLTFMGGARRQIFMVFAAFMMVEKFGYSVGQISLLYLVNYVFNLFFAPRIGAWIGRVGERRALTFEYIGLFGVFQLRLRQQPAWLAAALFIIDHFFFALAIAIKTYFQKIADPADIAGSAGVSFTINHIAAVVVPVVLGTVWMVSPAAVFRPGLACADVADPVPAYSCSRQPGSKPAGRRQQRQHQQVDSDVGRRANTAERANPHPTPQAAAPPQRSRRRLSRLSTRSPSSQRPVHTMVNSISPTTVAFVAQFSRGMNISAIPTAMTTSSWNSA